MHGRPQHIRNDQAEKLGDARILGLERVDCCQDGGEGRKANTEEHRSERPYRIVRFILSGDDLRE